MPRKPPARDSIMTPLSATPSTAGSRATPMPTPVRMEPGTRKPYSRTHHEDGQQRQADEERHEAADVGLELTSQEEEAEPGDDEPGHEAAGVAAGRSPAPGGGGRWSRRQPAASRGSVATRPARRPEAGRRPRHRIGVADGTRWSARLTTAGPATAPAEGPERGRDGDPRGHAPPPGPWPVRTRQAPRSREARSGRSSGPCWHGTALPARLWDDDRPGPSERQPGGSSEMSHQRRRAGVLAAAAASVALLSSPVASLAQDESAAPASAAPSDRAERQRGLPGRQPRRGPQERGPPHPEHGQPGLLPVVGRRGAGGLGVGRLRRLPARRERASRAPSPTPSPGQLGFTADQVDWIGQPTFGLAFAPGEKDFDFHLGQV